MNAESKSSTNSTSFDSAITHKCITIWPLQTPHDRGLTKSINHIDTLMPLRYRSHKADHEAVSQQSENPKQYARPSTFELKAMSSQRKDLILPSSERRHITSQQPINWSRTEILHHFCHSSLSNFISCFKAYVRKSRISTYPWMLQRNQRKWFP